MRLSNNERAFLEAIRDNDFRTIAEVTQACGFQRSMGLHYYMSLSIAGLIDGFEPTYLGYKILQGEDGLGADEENRVDIKIADTKRNDGR